MTARKRLAVHLIAAFVFCGSEFVVAQEEPTAEKRPSDAEKRAVAFLAKEVPSWRPNNGCFSCHNNGDGARAVVTAVSVGFTVEPQATAESLDFLTKPKLWENNGPDGPFNDRQLARLQFAYALSTAVKMGSVRERQPLLTAAELLAANQSASGAWDFSGEEVIGSPVTWGRPLAAAIGIRVLRRADPQRFAKAIAAAESWLAGLEPVSVLNAAAITHGLAQNNDPQAHRKREQCLTVIRENQTSDGGWGPYVQSAPEPFDTAVVLCVLSELDRQRWQPAIRSGRKFLEQSQFTDGSWPETTRPAGQESYAQRIATTAWATIALLETRDE